MRRVLNSIATAIVAAVLFVVMALPAWAAGDAMTLTFVRHGQSTANAAGILNTAVPGPDLTALGRQQALDVATALGGEHDGIYASTMIRTQQTAGPLSERLDLPVVVLPGLQEVGAGVFEGTAERGPLALLGYGGPPLAWTFGLRVVPILGSADSGNAFDARVDRAVKAIYDAGDRTPVVFSHGATIMFWVMMNVANPDPLLILTHPLDNTDVVVVTGAPDTGWTLTDWGGIRVDPNPSLLTRLFVVVRDVVAGLQGGWSPAPPVTSQPAPQSVPPTGVATIERSAAARADVVAHDGRASAATPTATAEPVAKAVSAHESARPDADEPPVAAGSVNGATDLSDGNMARPGTAEPKATESESDQAEPSTPPAAPKKVDAQPDSGTHDAEESQPAAA